MRQSQEAIREALERAELGADMPGLQPAILMNLNIDHEKVAEYTRCYVNEAHALKLKELIENGWIVFRIQTEFYINGHETHAYLAKMKAN